MTVGALAAHLARGLITVETYLDGPAAEVTVPPMSAARYFAELTATAADLDSTLNVGVRARAAEGATAGSATVLQSFAETLARLEARLGDERPDRRVAVIGGRVLTLDEYLLTRIVELTVHSDDLYASLGEETPSLAGGEVTIAVLVEVARLRHGDLAVVRALTRRERDPANALRVL